MTIKIKFGSEKLAEKWQFGLKCLQRPEWKILTKEFGSTYLCNRLSHRWLGEGGRQLWVVTWV